MGYIDLSLVAISILILMLISIAAQKQTKSVADFLAGNRCAGRYVLSISEGAVGIAVISILGQFEMFYQAGFAAVWWGFMVAIVWVLMASLGWVIYRYRQTRALTLGQFLEMRYSKRFRVFAGTLSWFSGIINYGIFPAVTARFFIYFCQIPQYYIDIGPFNLNMTLGLVMFLKLTAFFDIDLCGYQ